MFTRTLDTAVGPVVVEFHPAGWCVAPTHLNVAARLSGAERRALCIRADEIQDASAQPTPDVPARVDDASASEAVEAAPTLARPRPGL